VYLLPPAPFLLIDCLLKIWRMYVVYNKRFVVVAPAILLVVAYTGTVMRITTLVHKSNVLLFVVVACIVLNLMANFRDAADVFKAAEAWITAYSLLTMVTSVFCSGKLCIFPVKDTLSAHTATGAIALRIFVTGGPLRSTTAIWLIALVIVESSTLYALSVIATLATFLSGFNWQYPMVDAIALLVVSPWTLSYPPLSTTDPRVYSRAF
jgi:hypothetical protein